MRNSVIIILFLLKNIDGFAQKIDNHLIYKSQIDWSSFKGVPNDDSAGARISLNIHLEVSKVSVWNGNIIFKAYARMNPLESWVRPGYEDEHTLQHEQTHFNITEMCARGLQSELNKMKIRFLKSPAIQETFNKWQIKMEDLQNQYDLETKGGNISVAQHDWNQKILAELN